MKIYGLSLLIVLILSGCASKNDENLEKNLLSTQQIELYNINVNDTQHNSISGRELLKKFPFVTSQMVVGYRGKFSNKFYNKYSVTYSAELLKDVDFWKLKANPEVMNFIYILPTWAKQFKKLSNNLFEDIGYSYNLSYKEQEILQQWISQGGILWIEGGIYSTRYDTFRNDGTIDSESILNTVKTKSSNLVFLDQQVKSTIYQSKIVDMINFDSQSIIFKTKSSIPSFQDIKNLQIVTENYLTADFMPKGEVLLSSDSGVPLVTFVRHGKGGVVFLRPFEFQDKMYDGELLRWRLVDYLGNKLYLKQNEISKQQKNLNVK